MFVVGGVLCLVVGIGVPIVFDAPMGWRFGSALACLLAAPPLVFMKRWVGALCMFGLVGLLYVVVYLGLPAEWWLTGMMSWAGGLFLFGAVKSALWSAFGPPTDRPERVKA